MKRLLLLLSLSSFAHAGDVVIGTFQGLNTQDNPVALEDGESQDLLNVGITPGGKSVYKREGYGLHKTLTFSTSAVHGIHYFQDLSGSDIQLYGYDAFLAASVNGASPVHVATGTVATTWHCTDNSGYAYCVTSSRNSLVRTDGTTGGTTYYEAQPKGTMITNTPDRLVIAGVSGSASSLYFSQANTFTNFTVGINSADPFVEVINSPGSRLTHIRYACGKLLWWKDASFGYSIGSDQYNLENVTVSQNIGTLDNSSDEYNGNVYFRGQDNHIYQYDCANVTRLSRKITPTVAGSGRRKANSWTQSSQSEFNNGASITIVQISTAVSSGDVTQSSYTTTETSSNTFTLGVSTAITYQTNSIIISTNSAELLENDFENNTNWTYSGTYWERKTGVTGQSCTLSPKSGSTYFTHYPGAVSTTLNATVVDVNSGTSYGSATFAYVDNCTWTQKTISVSAGALRKAVKLRFYSTAIGSSYSLDSDTFTANTNSITFWAAGQRVCAGVPTCTIDNYTLNIDTVAGSGRSSISTATFQSQVIDTGFSASVAAVAANWTTDDFQPYMELQTSANPGGPFSKIAVSSGTSGTGQRYLRYISSFTVGASNDALTTLDDVTVIVKSTGGIYLSAVNNASGVSEWSTFSANDQTGGGTITYSVRASTSLFTVQSSTPEWASQSKNATVNYATGTYMQTRAAFVTTQATQTLSLNDFTFNWFEGNAVDKAYIKYWNDYVWVAVSSGTTGLNNRVQRWDILNQTWLLDDIAANGFLVDNNDLYFGSSSAGKIYKYGQGLATDDSAAINSYWKSKNFVGDDPFIQKNWEQSDFVVKAASPTVMSVTYQLDGSTQTTYLMNLYHPSKTILHKGANLSGRIGTFYNVRFGDSSSNPRWEIFGHRVRFTPLPWRPE